MGTFANGLGAIMAALLGGVGTATIPPSQKHHIKGGRKLLVPRDRSKRRNRNTVYHDTPRFARKMQKHGPLYRRGKLFKGHHI